MDFTGKDIDGKTPDEICDMLPENVKASWTYWRQLWHPKVALKDSMILMPNGIPTFSWIPHAGIYLVIAKSDDIQNIEIPKSRYVPHPSMLKSESLKKLLYHFLFKYDANVAGAIIEDDNGTWHEIGLVQDEDRVLTQLMGTTSLIDYLTKHGWKESDFILQTLLKEPLNSAPYVFNTQGSLFP